MLTEDDIFEIGSTLEHSGFVDEEIDLYLEHYGVKGMKWGVRKDRQQLRREARAKKFDSKADKAQTKISALGAKKNDARTRWGKSRLDTKISELNVKKAQAQSDAEAKRQGKLSRKQKRVLIGAAAVGTIVAAGVVYSTIQSGQANRLINKGKDFLKDKHDPGWKLDRSLSDSMDSETIMSKVVSKINPDYGAPGTKVNCRRATMAYEMRRRGYDVSATRTRTGSGQTSVGMHNALSTKSKNFSAGKLGGLYEVAKETGRGDDAYSEILDKNPWGEKNLNPTRVFSDLARKEPNGARGELGVKFRSGGGHSMAWEIIGGKPVIFDTQTGTKYESASDFKKIVDSMEELAYTRLDNKSLDTDFLMRWVKNA